MRRLALLVLIAFANPASAQVTVDQMIAQTIATGDSLSDRLRPDSALPFYQRAVALDSTGSRQLWKVGHALVDIANQLPDGSQKRRDSLYDAAAQYGWKAIAANNNDPDAHFVVGLALGHLALTKGGKERVKYGDWIQWEASLALKLRPDHDGAHHVLGAFHAEVQRLSGLTRFIAKTLFGARMLAHTNWDSAQVHLERAVAIDPAYIYHRLDLAKILIDRKRWADARIQLTAIAGLPPVSDVMDPAHKKEADALLAAIAKRK